MAPALWTLLVAAALARAEGSLERLRGLAAEGAEVSAPVASRGAAELAGVVGAYLKVSGHADCPARRSVGLVPEGLRLWSPDEIREDAGGPTRLAGGSRVFERIDEAASRTTTPFAVQSGSRRLESRRRRRTTLSRTLVGLELLEDDEYEDNFRSHWSRTALRFKSSGMRYLYEDAWHGDKIYGGGRLDLNRDCRYARVGAEPWTDPPVDYEPRRFRASGRLCAGTCLVSQPAALEVSFETERIKNVNGERIYRDVRFELSLAAGDGRPAYALRGPGGPGAREQRFTSYSKASAARLETFFELEAYVDEGARGTVLEEAAGRPVTVRFYPYCRAAECRLGTLAGVMLRPGSPLRADFRLLSEEAFTMGPPTQ